MGSTIIIRLNRESPRKCSLTPIRGRSDLGITWHHCNLGDDVEVGEVVLLHPDGEPLSVQDSSLPLLLVDSSWRDLPRMLATVKGKFQVMEITAEHKVKSNKVPNPLAKPTGSNTAPNEPAHVLPGLITGASLGPPSKRPKIYPPISDSHTITSRNITPCKPNCESTNTSYCFFSIISFSWNQAINFDSNSNICSCRVSFYNKIFK